MRTILTIGVLENGAICIKPGPNHCSLGFDYKAEALVDEAKAVVGRFF